MHTTPPKPKLIADDHALAECSQQWQRCDALAMDTEFVRTDTFYANLGLIQISDGSDCWLIDPLAINDFSPLVEVMQNPRIVKAFHATSEDLEILQQALGCLPEPLFDTQVAAALVGYGYSKGYAGLVNVLLGIQLGKHETRSDWTKRPLSEAQLGYAAEDVYYLAAIYPLLKQRLAEFDRSDWMEQEMQQLLASAREPANSGQYYLRVKAAWQLDPRGLVLLQQLCDWREQEARLCNKPRNRIIADKALLEIAACKPSSNQALRETAGLHPAALRKYSEKLLLLIAKNKQVSGRDYLPPLEQPLPREAAGTIKKLKAVVNQVAEQLDLPPEILAKKRDIEALVRSIRDEEQPALPKVLAQGWRFNAVGQPLMKLAKTL